MSYDPRLIGFSQKIHGPAFEEQQKAKFRKTRKIALIFFPVAILLFQIVPFFADSWTHAIALGVGFIVGGFGLVWVLITEKKRSSAKTWDGEVIDKKTTQHRRDNGDENTYAPTYYYKHTIYFRLANGGKKKMTVSGNTGAPDEWDMMVYLNIGDRVRYHGRFDYYEKYDKSRDAELPCANCKKYADIRLDHCPHCNLPLIKP